MELFLAIPATGNVVLVLPSTLHHTQLSSIVDKFDVKVIFTDRKNELTIENNGIPVLDCLETSDEEAVLEPCSFDTPAAVFLTSGTTGKLKGALHSHGSVLYAAHNSPAHYYARYGTLKGCLDRRVVLSLPLSHVMGMVTSVLFSLYTRSLLYICTDFKKSLMKIPSFQPDWLVLVPGMVEVFLNLLETNREYYSCVRRIVCGAAEAESAWLKKAIQLGIQIFSGYGLTETAGALFSNCDFDILPDSVGPVLDDVQVCFVNRELWVKSPSLMIKYYNDPELTEQAFEDGWFKTGDLGRLEECNGKQYLIITGRLKNLIILSNGENVSPEELEELLKKYDVIKDCQVKEMALNGNKVIGAEIVPGAMLKSRKEVDEIIEDVNRNLPSFKQIRMYQLRETDFEQTSVMKTVRTSYDGT